MGKSDDVTRNWVSRDPASGVADLLLMPYVISKHPIERDCFASALYSIASHAMHACAHVPVHPRNPVFMVTQVVAVNVWATCGHACQGAFMVCVDACATLHHKAHILLAIQWQGALCSGMHGARNKHV